RRGSVHLCSDNDPFGILDVCGRRLRNHWRCGMAWGISAVWSWNSHPEPVRAIHRAEDLATDSRATVKASRRIMKGRRKELSSKQREELLGTLKARFEKNMNRHQDVEWAKVRAKLEANPEKLWSLKEME